MLGDVLKALEILLETLRGRHSPEHKRQALAKDILKLHRALDAIVHRGRQILEQLSEKTVAHTSVTVKLLSEQVQALNDVRQIFTSGPVDDILKLHLPGLTTQLTAFLHLKSSRVWVALDQIVSEGGPLSPQDWVARMEAAMDDSNAINGRLNDPLKEGAALSIEERLYQLSSAVTEPRIQDHMNLSRVVFDVSASRTYPLDVALRSPGAAVFGKAADKLQSDVERFDSRVGFGILAESTDVAKGRQLLDQIAEKNDELRKFIIRSFEFEDLL